MDLKEKEKRRSQAPNRLSFNRDTLPTISLEDSAAVHFGSRSDQGSHVGNALVMKTTGTHPPHKNQAKKTVSDPHLEATDGRHSPDTEKALKRLRMMKKREHLELDHKRQEEAARHLLQHEMEHAVEEGGESAEATRTEEIPRRESRRHGQPQSQHSGFSANSLQDGRGAGSSERILRERSVEGMQVFCCGSNSPWSILVREIVDRNSISVFYFSKIGQADESNKIYLLGLPNHSKQMVNFSEVRWRSR